MGEGRKWHGGVNVKRAGTAAFFCPAAWRHPTAPPIHTTHNDAYHELPSHLDAFPHSLTTTGLRRLPHAISSSPLSSSSSFRLFSTSDNKKTEEKGGGHSVPGQAPQEMDPELVRVQTLLMEHQKTAARLTAAEEARTLVYYSQGLGVLGTNSQASSPLAGYPASAMVGFAVDEQGRPIFSFSSISTHKQDLIKDPRGSFTVASKVSGCG